MNRWLVGVVGLAAALVALGSWVLIDRSTEPQYDATTLIDDPNGAWSAGDAETVATFCFKLGVTPPFDNAVVPRTAQ